MNLIKPAFAQGVDLGKEFGFGNINTLGEGFDRLVLPGFGIAALAVVFYFLFGAFKLLTSGGDKNAVEGAKNMITHALIGFVLLMMMFLILQYLPQAIGLPKDQYSIIKR